MVFRAKAVLNNRRPLLPPCVSSLRRFKGPVLPGMALGIAIAAAPVSARGSELPPPTAVKALKIGFVFVLSSKFSLWRPAGEMYKMRRCLRRLTAANSAKNPPSSSPNH